MAFVMQIYSGHILILVYVQSEMSQKCFSDLINTDQKTG